MPLQDILMFYVVIQIFQRKIIHANCSDYGAYPIFTLFSQTNSHVQNYTIDNYNYDVCMKIPKYDLDVSYRETTCIENEVCLISISNYTNAHIGNCSYYDTQICLNSTFTNNLPYVSYIDLSPINPNTSEDLNCSFKIIDVDVGDSLYANYSWYKNGILQSEYSGRISVTNDTLAYRTLSSSYTEHFQNWSCKITPLRFLLLRTI
jgi:hypothetical protein